MNGGSQGTCYPNPNNNANVNQARYDHCVFCKNNGEEASFYTTHTLKDDLNGGGVMCPVLQAYTCPICGATGRNAHTIRYCPKRFVNGAAPDSFLHRWVRQGGDRRSSILDSC